MVSVWAQELRKVSPSKKLLYIYLANDLLQQAKRKQSMAVLDAFGKVLPQAFNHAVR